MNPLFCIQAGDLAPNPLSSRHVTRTPRAAISGPQAKYVNAAAVAGTWADTAPIKDSIEVWSPAGLSVGRLLSLKIVSRCGSSSECSDTQVEWFTRKTSSWSGRTIIKDRNAINNASTMTRTVPNRESSLVRCEVVVLSLSQEFLNEKKRTPIKSIHANGQSNPSRSIQANRADTAISERKITVWDLFCVLVNDGGSFAVLYFSELLKRE